MNKRQDYKRTLLQMYKKKCTCCECDCASGNKMLVFVQNGNEIRTISSIIHQPWSKVVADLQKLDVICTQCYQEQNS